MVLSYAGLAVLLFGVILGIAVGVALIKQSNIYTVMHVGSVTDAIGNVLCLLGIALLFFGQNNIAIGLKVMLLAVLVYVVNPLSAYAISKIIYFYDNEASEKK